MPSFTGGDAMIQLKGWALALGASSGFGEATSLALARAGLNVFGVHLDRKATLGNVERIVSAIKALGREAVFFNVNAADPEKRAEVVGQMERVLEDRSEPGALRVLLHSLAFGTLKLYVADPMKEAVNQSQMDMTLDVMAHSLVYWTQEVVGRGLMTRGGRIYAMTSSGGTRVLPFYGPVAAGKTSSGDVHPGCGPRHRPGPDRVPARLVLGPSHPRAPRLRLARSGPRLRCGHAPRHARGARGVLPERAPGNGLRVRPATTGRDARHRHDPRCAGGPPVREDHREPAPLAHRDRDRDRRMGDRHVDRRSPRGRDARGARRSARARVLGPGARGRLRSGARAHPRDVALRDHDHHGAPGRPRPRHGGPLFLPARHSDHGGRRRAE